MKIKNCKSCGKVLPKFEKEHSINICWLCDNSDHIYPIFRTSQLSYLINMIAFYDDIDDIIEYKNHKPCKSAFLAHFQDRFSNMDVELYFVDIQNMSEFCEGIGESVIIHPIKEFLYIEEFPKLEKFKFYIEICDFYRK